MLNEETELVIAKPFNIQHSPLNIQHLGFRSVLLFLAQILFASSLSA